MSKVIKDFRSKFPLLQNDYIYLDSAASSPMCLDAIEAVDHTVRYEYSNVHRGLCFMAQQTTELFESGRAVIANFIGASSPNTIVYTSGATMAANILIHGIGHLLQAGDGILLSPYEHHAVIVPWMMMKDRFNLHLYWMPLLENGNIDENGVLSLLKNHPNIKVMALTHMANVNGYIPPTNLIHMAKDKGLIVLMDGSQGLPHCLPNTFSVEDLGIDAYFFAGHKIFSPNGIGAFYATPDLLNRMPPLLGGGHMITEVSLYSANYQSFPEKFEAGTPNITGAIGLKAALQFYKQNVTQELYEEHYRLFQYLKRAVLDMGLEIFLGEANPCRSIITIVSSIHPQDMAGYLSNKNICTRAGLFCAEPLFITTQFPTGGLRISLGYYTTQDEIDHLIEALNKCIKVLG